ncbi:MAG: DUF4097 domain-containing protein [Flavobacteriaceae bacterium]|uniref:hypothetical protein n=1 Tax=Flagellimonas sp. SN16 TaxID=3415142 RepID=UPI003C680284|nr:DUF4097 domain-containing protein [Flavobacteriaceae bacterium]
MRATVFLLGFFFLVQLQGQKLVKKAFVGPRTDYIQIDAANCYTLTLNTAPINEVNVSASIEGEYAKDLLVSIEEEGATVRVSSGFHPNFINPNDKLSAHKVISIALEITVPEYKNVSVFGTHSEVQVEGRYSDLNIKLSDGRCILKNVSEIVQVNTQNGDIWLTALSGNVMAESAYGEVEQNQIPKGNHQYVLKTVEGNIHLRKTK